MQSSASLPWMNLTKSSHFCHPRAELFVSVAGQGLFEANGTLFHR